MGPKNIKPFTETLYWLSAPYSHHHKNITRQWEKVLQEKKITTGKGSLFAKGGKGPEKGIEKRVSQS
jgi:hypothetical protein